MSIDLRQSIDRVLQDLHADVCTRRVFRGAMAQAYVTCGRHYYPKWASYLLDKEFQAPGEGHLRDCYLQGTGRIGPAELARLWANQIEWITEDAKQRHVAELVPVAERFLQLLVLEICDRPELQPNFDSVARLAVTLPAPLSSVRMSS